MYHRIELIGNLGRDPEMRYLPDGRPVTTLNIATNRTYTDQSGQQVKETAWFRVSVFGKMAEACAQYLTKGRPVFVEGRLQHDKTSGGPRIWTRQDGTAGSSFEVVASTVKFLGGRGEAGPAEPGEEPQGIPVDVPETDIPF